MRCGRLINRCKRGRLKKKKIIDIIQYIRRHIGIAARRLHYHGFVKQIFGVLFGGDEIKNGCIEEDS